MKFAALIASVALSAASYPNQYAAPVGYVAKAPAVCPSGNILSVVKDGDNLYDLSKENNYDFHAVLASNPQFENPDLIYPGDQVCIPEGCAPFSGPETNPYDEAVAPTDNSKDYEDSDVLDNSVQPYVPKTPAVCPSGNILSVVKDGDNLWALSKEHNYDFHAVLASNPQFENPDLIYPGDQVCIPEGCAPFSGPETNPYDEAVAPAHDSKVEDTANAGEDYTKPSGFTSSATSYFASSLALVLVVVFA
ncbi:MAG: hypothetical protein SGCHY_002876 [Lobulomycetales sp.]